MKYTTRIATIFKIPLRLHWSFALLLAYIAGVAWYQHIEKEAIFLHVLFVIAMFSCVLLHELGHAAAAAFYGIPTIQIVLLPIGGIAFFERVRRRPSQDFIIAFAGPLTNFLIAALIYVGILLSTPAKIEYIGIEDQLFNIGVAFFERLLWLNLLIGAFNLLPAYPLDGGQMLRALLTLFLEKKRAVFVQFCISLLMASLVLVYSYWKHAPEYIFFAWLMYFSSRNEWAKENKES
jgi:Zn-dependent protease